MKIKLYILVILFLAGCTTSGNYQNFNGSVGYQSSQEADNQHNVSYTGTSSTNIKKVNDFVLLRSAEIALENGYEYFIITDATNNRNASGYNSTDLTSLSTRVAGNGPSGSWSNSGGVERKSEMTILLYNEKPDSLSYDAEMIRRAIRNEYELEDDPS